MTRYIALLRGVNVGGKHRVPMAELKTLLAERGYTNIATYIQSGNVAMTSDRTRAELQADVAEGIEQRFGFPVPVVAVEREELLRIQAANPWADEPNPKGCHVFFFPGPIPDATAEKLRALELRGADELAVGEDAVYLHTPDGLLTHKAGDVVGRLTPGATARNLATVAKLVELVG